MSHDNLTQSYYVHHQIKQCTGVPLRGVGLVMQVEGVPGTHWL